MPRPSLRDTLIASGVTTLHERGYAACGIREITGAAGVPQGSFTNHFRSKEAFAIAVLDRYFGQLEAIMAATLRDEARPPLDRLRGYFDAIGAILEAAGWRHGCLIANMGLEAPEHSEAIRERLVGIFAALTLPFADAVRAAQTTGDGRGDCEAGDLAAFVLSAWHGTLLRMKVERSAEPVERFKRVLFAMLSPAPATPLTP